MSSNKTLKITPNLFTISNRSKSNKNIKQREKPKLKNNDIINTNKVKNKLLSQVKNYQKKIEEEKKKDDNSYNIEKNINIENNFESEFNKSLSFLKGLAEKKKKKKKTIKENNNQNINKYNVNIELPNELKNSEIYNNQPLYGCLKDGNMLTYRNYIKTKKNKDDYNFSEKKVKIFLEKDDENIDVKNNTDIYIKDDIDIDVKDKIDIDVKNKIDTDLKDDIDIDVKDKIDIDLKDDLDIDVKNDMDIDFKDKIEKNFSIFDKPLDNNIKINKKYDKIIPKKLRITRTIKHKIGKDKENNKIGILLKDRKTIKNINKETTQLKNKSIQEIKEFLREKNIIKSGSIAPNDVLRKMYESAILSGNINNINMENLVYNYNN